MQQGPRLAVDIGGTFTDIVLEIEPGRFISAKYLTTHAAPEQAVLQGTRDILARGGVAAPDLAAFIHGTTLATNAVIEGKGASLALLTTKGFRDTLEMTYEHRFDVNDLYLERPAPLVKRGLRLEAHERLAADGSVLRPLDEASVLAHVPLLREQKIETLAICFLHSYMSGVHETRAGALLQAELPDLRITLSHEVSPEIREYDRSTTACVNAYVQPLIEGYLRRLEQGFREMGGTAPLMLMTSNGGLATIDMACRQPVRLIESGPAGGAILASRIARQNGLANALAFDMGGTTAKLVLIESGQPHYSRSLEVARASRFMKGSGMPLLIPNIDLVEIGAGGGSVGHIDELGRIAVGPESLGSEPGPACYGRGSDRPGVTDADLVLGKIDPAGFADGKMALDRARAEAALLGTFAGLVGTDVHAAAAGICEVVDENMANAARIHAVDRGHELEGKTMIAFGGAAPLHAVRIAEKVGIDEIIIPRGAGVGSAYGFLLAPVSCETVRTRLVRLETLTPGYMNELFGALHAEALAVVREGAPEAELDEQRICFMRYRGQGHEVAVRLPAQTYGPEVLDLLKAEFERVYEQQFTAVLPGMEIECVTWTLMLSERRPEEAPHLLEAPTEIPAPGSRSLYDARTGTRHEAVIIRREALVPGRSFDGPLVIHEAETTTVVTPGFRASANAFGQIVIRRI